MSNPKDAFATIDPDALSTVVGGRRSSTASSSGSDQIMDALNSLENSIRDLGRNQSNQPDAMSQMMPLLMMMMMNQQPAAAPAQPTVVCQGSGGKKGW